MRKIVLPLTLVAVAAFSLPAMPAQALVARTFLSATGSDSNNCANVVTPCRHLATAFAATAPDGEIYVLDPANYGSVTISHGVSIEGHGWASIAPVSGNAAITINANPGDKINIIGVVLDGTAISATTGIFFIAGGILNVKDSVIRNFTQSGINFTPSTSSQSQIFVSNTLVSDNGSDGILINPTGSGTTNGILSRVYVENNGGNGLNFLTATQTINVTVTDSVSASSSLNGVNAESDGGTAVSIMVRNSTIANNTLEGLQATGTGDTIRVTRSTITGNSSGWGAGSSGVVLSYADNNIDGNGVVNSEPPNALTYK